MSKIVLHIEPLTWRKDWRARLWDLWWSWIGWPLFRIRHTKTGILKDSWWGFENKWRYRWKRLVRMNRLALLSVNDP